MRVLLHDSHHDPTRPCGWSGAPGECEWVMLLNSLIVERLAAFGIGALRVPGDLNDHPAFHDPDYQLFIAPHYESDTHGDHARGWLWGRAAASPTATEDDRFGHIFERNYSGLTINANGPPEHPDWLTVNISDYYGFRLDRAVPGILVEHGIGDGADKLWIRENIQAIAQVHAESVAEYLGVEVGVTGDQAKDLIREMLRSEEGADLVRAAILRPNGYGPALALELNQRFKEVEVKSVIEAQLGVKPECLRQAP